MDDQHLSEEPQPNEPRPSVPPPPPVDPRFGIPPQQTPEELKRKRPNEFFLGCFGMLAFNLLLVKIAFTISDIIADTSNVTTVVIVLLLLLNLTAIFGSFTILKRPNVAYGIIAMLAGVVVMPLLLMGICMALFSYR